ncbi:MAG: branched-chain amino acid aminotransferase [Flavobacteriaceae bacterium TMED206]|nr:MAG: branched-chain amino acid aminotransferase [Flavobacteriaceae bacterium TMED206]|tara:strand:+ start:5386 stop:6444 length:1059 start_codon:yes stop_codon:yes gene_type:complete
MRTEKTSISKLDSTDFNNLKFGETFTDHMFVCDYEDGKWVDPRVVPYKPIEIEPSANVFHYGQAVFEGMKGYKDDLGKIWLFRPTENYKRISISSERLAMPELGESLFLSALNELLTLDSDWVKPGIGNSVYIRPFVFGSEHCIAASPSRKYKFMIILSPVQSYYTGSLKVLVAEKYSRAANGGVGFAKAAGNYGSQFYPTGLAQKQGYDQIIWTDSKNHKFIEEAGTMNIFVRIDDTLITAPTTDTILDGITRKSIIKIAEDNDIKVEVRPISIDEVIEAHSNERLKEIFGSGTAVVVSEISSFGYKGKNYNLKITENSYATTLKSTITKIQYNLIQDPYGWRSEVSAIKV